MKIFLLNNPGKWESQIESEHRTKLLYSYSGPHPLYWIFFFLKKKKGFLPRRILERNLFGWRVTVKAIMQKLTTVLHYWLYFTLLRLSPLRVKFPRNRQRQPSEWLPIYWPASVELVLFSSYWSFSPFWKLSRSVNTQNFRNL